MKKKTVKPEDVLMTLDERMSVTGLKLVIDPLKSAGLTIFDSWHEKEFIDFSFGGGRIPLTYNHRGFKDEEYIKRMRTATPFFAPADEIYSSEYATFVREFSRFALDDDFISLRFGSSHSDAVEMALKAAFDYKAQKNIRSSKKNQALAVVCLEEAFHGFSGYALSLHKTSDVRTDGFYPLFDFPAIINPKLKFPASEKNMKRVEQLENEAILQLKAHLQNGKRSLCAVIIEPVQGRGGDNYFRNEFFKKLKELSEENDFLLIFDETLTGFGTCGAKWAHSAAGVTPDILIFGGKSPLAGVAGGKCFEQVESVFNVPGRLSGGPVVNLSRFVYGAKLIEIIEDEKLLENAKKIGVDLGRRLSAICESSPYAKNPRATGVMGALDFHNEKARDKIIRSLFEEGFIAAACGVKTVALRLPLDAPLMNVHKGLDIFERVILSYSD